MEAQTVEQSGGSGSSFTAPEAREATRESLSRAYHAIQAREKAEVSRSPVIHDEARQRAVAERKAEEESYRSAGLPAFESAAPASVRDSMSAAFHRAEAKEARAEARRMPALKGDTTLRQQLEASADWRELDPADQKLFKSGHTELESQREAARWFGLSLEEAKVTAIEKRLEQQDRVRPELDRLARVSGRDPAEVLSWHTSWAEAFKRNPELAYHQLGEQLHIEQDHQERQQFQQHQATQRQRFEAHARAVAAQARQAAIGRAVLSHVEDYARGRPDFARLEPQMVAALESGRVRRTGNAARDLEAAYKAVGGDY